MAIIEPRKTFPEGDHDLPIVRLNGSFSAIALEFDRHDNPDTVVELELHVSDDAVKWGPVFVSARFLGGPLADWLGKSIGAPEPKVAGLQTDFHGSGGFPVRVTNPYVKAVMRIRGSSIDTEVRAVGK